MFTGDFWKTSAFILLFCSTSGATRLEADEFPQNAINEIMVDLEAAFHEMDIFTDEKKRAISSRAYGNDDEFERAFPIPDRPITRPISSSSSPFQGFIPTHGFAYTTAVEVLYQTLMYFGVNHYFAKSGNSIDFVVISSSEGYFQDLDSAKVAFALREFSRYLIAHLCGDPSAENFYKIFNQVPFEEVGLRFKFEMAWALMGNYLPKDPNDLMRLGDKWDAVHQFARTQSSIPQAQRSELQKYTQIISDVFGFMKILNKNSCYADISINPREQIIWRVVVKTAMKAEKEILERYEENRKLVEEMRAREKAQQMQSLKNS